MGIGEQSMRLNTLRIPCKDLDQASEFYNQILDAEPSFGSAAEGYIGFRLLNVNILLEHVEPGEFESD